MYDESNTMLFEFMLRRREYFWCLAFPKPDDARQTVRKDLLQTPSVPYQLKLFFRSHIHDPEDADFEVWQVSRYTSIEADPRYADWPHSCGNRVAAPLYRRLRRLHISRLLLFTMSSCVFMMLCILMSLSLPDRLIVLLADFCFLFLSCFAWSCLTLLEDACFQLDNGHSALRTMWLSAPVLAYVPVDVSHWRMRHPNRLMHVWVCGVAVADWHVGIVVLVAMGRYGCS